jgi:5,6-dimethylbenzimidazole synthase
MAMDLFEAMEGRRSCRAFLPDPVDEDTVLKILQAGTWAPSPMNAQPWEFVVVTRDAVKIELFKEAEQRREWGQEVSGWKWLGGYRVDFVKSAPVIIAVIGDPKKTGLDSFQEEGGVGYQHACAAAIQNMHLAAHALGLGTLWFTLFDRQVIRKTLDIPDEKTPLALICLGKPAKPSPAPPRKEAREKTRFLR